MKNKKFIKLMKDELCGKIMTNLFEQKLTVT